MVKKYKMRDGDFLTRFWPGSIWDIKGQHGIPKNEKSYPEWAKYKNVLVHDAYIANNAFGHAAGARGLSLEKTLDRTDRFYKLTHLNNHDQPEDQAAIISGWWEEHTGDPWPSGLRQPLDYWILKSLFPKTYQRETEQFTLSPEFFLLIEKSKSIK